MPVCCLNYILLESSHRIVSVGAPRATSTGLVNKKDLNKLICILNIRTSYEASPIPGARNMVMNKTDKTPPPTEL